MKQFTKITVLGLVFALALGSANCKKDEKDDTGTMLALLLLLNQSSCGKLDYSLGYFMAQVAPPTALTGVGGYPWSYESCKPTYSQNGSATEIGPVTVSGGTTTTYTYTNGYLTKKVVSGTNKISAGVTGYDGVDGAISGYISGATTFTGNPNCPSNRLGTSVKENAVVGTTTYTRDSNNNVTTEETKYTCGGNDVKAWQSTYGLGLGYAKKVMTYNADNRILTLKYYLNSDFPYNATSTATIEASLTNASGSNPVATMNYTYTPSSGIPTTVKVEASAFYESLTTSGSTTTYAVTTDAVDKVTWNFTTVSAGVLSAATYTEECQTVEASKTSSSVVYSPYYRVPTTGTNCGAVLTSGTSYGTSSTAAYQSKPAHDARTRTITLTQDTKNTSRLASYKIETVTKTWSNDTTSGTVTKTTTGTVTNNLFYDSNGRLDKRVSLSNTKYAFTTATACTAGNSPDAAGACDGTTRDTRSVETYSYNGNGLGVFKGAETFSTATSEEATSNPTLWNVK